MLVYLTDGSALTVAHDPLRQKLQFKRSTSTSHTILTPGQSFPALTLYYQAPCRVGTGVQMFKSLVLHNPEKSPWREWELNPGSSALEADALKQEN